jgi:uncharacterized membrane protein
MIDQIKEPIGGGEINLLVLQLLILLAGFHQVFLIIPYHCVLNEEWTVAQPVVKILFVPRLLISVFTIIIEAIMNYIFALLLFFQLLWEFQLVLSQWNLF